MNHKIRVCGWLLFGMGSVLILSGLMAWMGLLHIRVDYLGINLDTNAEWIAWIVIWLVTVVTGSLLLALTKTEDQNKSF